ncbi:hypothetical protein HRQ91_10990 [Treponema parvum]|uniref:Uncharacterized protein n=1 Tax=Treponema parvum TaxID=138851 RepID=A0A975F5V6_9SPIR|nr:hypothetical protein [Treponema parvum]QTQ14942.1 hypothetical protein HRQ91_10990 [Treponema parvum]
MRKLIFAAAQAVFCILFAAALPGIDPYIPDVSGEYVYYRDNTFSRKSYIGFLYYDEATYAARYYAPGDREKQLPEKSVGILFSVDPLSDHMEMTGERFLDTITPDDTDIVNYLHDMVYEFNARRQKAGNISPAEVALEKNFSEQGAVVKDDFMQFGGYVSMLYDYAVPLFNLKRISASNGEVLLEAVTAGRLVSSEDNSFYDFTGFPEVLKDSSDKQKLSVPAEKKKYTVNISDTVQEITLDSLWTQSSGNVWALGDDAVLSVNVIFIPEDIKETFSDVLQRNMILSAQNSYSAWEKLDFSASSSSRTRMSLSSYYYQNKTGVVLRDFKIITKISEDKFGYVSMTVFDDSYVKNRAYFNQTLKTYTIVNSAQQAP